MLRLIKEAEDNKELEPIENPADDIDVENMEEIAADEADMATPEQAVPAEETIELGVEIQAYKNEISSMINDVWGNIEHISSVVATLEMDYHGDNKENLQNLLNIIIDDLTVDIGMLYKAAELVDPKASDLIDAGNEKAEEIINSQENQTENTETDEEPEEKVEHTEEND